MNFYPKVLVLLDVTPDQSLLSEGVAREVVNRIQKLRKKVIQQILRDLKAAEVLTKTKLK